MLIPLLIVFYAGQLVWRERDAGLSEIADATPVPEWALFLGKFLGLSFVLVMWMALVATAGVLGQMRMGYFDIETYSAMRVVEETIGPEHLRLLFMREEFSAPRTRAAPAQEAWFRSAAPSHLTGSLSGASSGDAGFLPIPATRSLRKNTFWELATERATAKQTSADAWQVTLDVRARKVVVDEAGIETEAPMDDRVEVECLGRASLTWRRTVSAPVSRPSR